MNIINVIISLMLFVSFSSAQNSFYLRPQTSLKLNFTEVLDPDASPVRVLESSLNLSYGLGLGYKLKKHPVSFETGYSRANYDTKMVIRDKSPIGFGFGKPIVVKTPITANEFEARLIWNYAKVKESRFRFDGSIGFVFMRNISPRNPDEYGHQKRKADGIPFDISYNFLSFTGAWASTRFEGGIGASYQISKAVNINIRNTLGIGLRPFQVRKFSYKITKPSASLSDTDEIIIVDKGDQAYISLGVQVFLNPTSNSKRKK
jgi:hypothetical protein